MLEARNKGNPSGLGIAGELEGPPPGEESCACFSWSGPALGRKDCLSLGEEVMEGRNLVGKERASPALVNQCRFPRLVSPGGNVGERE